MSITVVLKLMRSFLQLRFLVAAVLIFWGQSVFSQTCTTLGQTPATAFPVCGTTVFHQAGVPLCETNSLFVPGCTGDGANYANKNPFFYKFTCFVAGTLGFRITPLAADEDYDWQLYDITDHNPNDIFTNSSLVLTGNWAGTYGATGAASGGSTSIQCASAPGAGAPTFSAMPSLIAGHEYLLMISHYTDGESGYDLSFGGGTAVIDPLQPHMLKVTPNCDGTSLVLTLNKKVRCTSFAGNGSEFSLSLPNTITSAVTDSCALGFDFDEVTIIIGTPLTSGTHSLIINNGTDGNTLLDNCGRPIRQENQFLSNTLFPNPSVPTVPAKQNVHLIRYYCIILKK